MRYFPLILLMILLSACQSSGEVVKAGADTYMVSSHVSGCINCSATVQGLKTANEYCEKQGKEVEMLSSEGVRNNFGYEVGAELIFKCVNKK